MVRTMLKPALAAACVLIALSSSEAATRQAERLNVVLRWNQALLQAVRETRMPPPQVARALAIVHTCMYDAWAAYDSRGVGTQLGGRLRRPRVERSDSNKAEAMSHAAYLALVDLFPSRRDGLFDPLMTELGYAPPHSQAATSTAATIGSVAAAAVIAFRHDDGANQLGTMTPSGVPYADYMSDPNRWQPLLQPDGQPQRFLVPHWSQVVPFALTSSSQFRPPEPAMYGTADYWHQAIELIYTSAALTDRTKSIAAYWADGPSTETPPGHWMLFAQAVSARDRHTLDQDVKLFFALGNALLDASIAAWDCKVAFDYVRPVSAIRLLFAGQQIPSWAGPYRGTQRIDGSMWQTYIATPPFAEYVSGHSTFSAAAAAVLSRFTGSDAMRFSVIIPAGSSPLEPGAVPASDITLSWQTFTEAADQAGVSRRYGGIHFRDGDLAARDIGRRVGAQAWKKALTYFGETARRGNKDGEKDEGEE
jgi:PAP2 superfamily